MAFLAFRFFLDELSLWASEGPKCTTEWKWEPAADYVSSCRTHFSGLWYSLQGFAAQHLSVLRIEPEFPRTGRPEHDALCGVASADDDVRKNDIGSSVLSQKFAHKFDAMHAGFPTVAAV